MKEIYGLKITNTAVDMIERYSGVKIETLEEKKLIRMIKKMKKGVDYLAWQILLKTDSSNTYIWNSREDGVIAKVKDSKGERVIASVSGLKIYLSKYSDEDEYSKIAQYEDVSWFTNEYFDINKDFKTNFESLDFKYCSESFYNLLKESSGEVDIQPTIEKIGDDEGKDVYKIGDKIFYLIHRCYNLGRDHYYNLTEVDKRCYEKFGYEKPKCIF
ncbi:hypothetical protein [Clostridium sp.]|uniref:hypothetical protein n=1 Tax=Clostridium sp. TaxID=1506 RepID=UPI0029128B0F|nr:hypothetical protein [Clostridium sp.]MDU5108531.1 hypothetical protein [Clostridium sp.]